MAVEEEPVTVFVGCKESWATHWMRLRNGRRAWSTTSCATSIPTSFGCRWLTFLFPLPRKSQRSDMRPESECMLKTKRSG